MLYYNTTMSSSTYQLIQRSFSIINWMCVCVLMYVYVHKKVKTRSATSESIPQELPTLFFETGFLTGPGLTKSAMLPGLGSPKDSSILHLQRQHYRPATCSAFYMGSGDLTWVLELAQQALSGLSYLLSSSLSFSGFFLKI